MPLTKEQERNLEKGAVVSLDDAPPSNRTVKEIAPGAWEPEKRRGRVWSRLHGTDGVSFLVRWFTDDGHMETATLRGYEITVVDVEG